MQRKLFLYCILLQLTMFATTNNTHDYITRLKRGIAYFLKGTPCSPEDKKTVYQTTIIATAVGCTGTFFLYYLLHKHPHPLSQEAQIKQLATAITDANVIRVQFLLINQKIDPNAYDIEGFHLLYTAILQTTATANKDATTIALLLLEHGANPDMPFNSMIQTCTIHDYFLTEQKYLPHEIKKKLNIP